MDQGANYMTSIETAEQLKTKTHIRHITSFEQQNFDIAQSLVEA